MTIPLVRPGGWAAASELLSTELTTFDVNLSTRVLDKTGDTSAGAVTIGGGIDVNGLLRVTASGKGIATASSGRVQSADNDDETYSPPRTRVVTMSMMEYQYGSDAYAKSWHWDDTQKGITAASRGVGSSPLILPLTRLHNGAALLSVTLYFRPPAASLGTFQPTFFPSFDIVRINQTLAANAVPLRAAGPAVFPTMTAANYQSTPALGSKGSIVAGVIQGSISLLAGQILTDTAGLRYQVTTGGTYVNGALIPVAAIDTGSATNHPRDDLLTWAIKPANALPTAAVSAATLSGGADPGYAQSLVYVPDAGLQTIDTTTYLYVMRITDDNIGTAYIGGPPFTAYTGMRLAFGNITTGAFQ